jgi:ribose/xylose/arabinose/galactoside ABC-type transport system permease subunit
MKNTLFALLGLLAAAAAAYFLYRFQHNDDQTSMIIGIILAIVAVVFGGLFMFGRVNSHDEIHVTE